jgi:hypothetical protein
VGPRKEKVISRVEAIFATDCIIKAMQALEGTAAKTATGSQEDLQMED